MNEEWFRRVAHAVSTAAAARRIKGMAKHCQKASTSTAVRKVLPVRSRWPVFDISARPGRNSPTKLDAPRGFLEG